MNSSRRQNKAKSRRATSWSRGCRATKREAWNVGRVKLRNIADDVFHFSIRINGRYTYKCNNDIFAGSCAEINATKITRAFGSSVINVRISRKRCLECQGNRNIPAVDFEIRQKFLSNSPTCECYFHIELIPNVKQIPR